MLAGFIDTEALAKTVVAAFVSGVGVTLIFSIALYGAARSAQMGREGRNSSAMAFGALALVGGLVFVAAIVVGIVVMTTK
jgi:hypothetical protein